MSDSKLFTEVLNLHLSSRVYSVLTHCHMLYGALKISITEFYFAID